MTTDACRLMRPGARRLKGAEASVAACQYRQAARPRFAGAGTADRSEKNIRAGPYEGLSRMKGNFHVRFLEGGGPATARSYSTYHSCGLEANVLTLLILALRRWPAGIQRYSQIVNNFSINRAENC